MRANVNNRAAVSNRQSAVDRLKLKNFFYSIYLQGFANRIETPVTMNPNTASSFTLALQFMMFEEYPFNSTIYSQEDGGGTGRSWFWIQNLTNHLLTTLGGTTQDTGVRLVPGRWYDVILSYDGTKIYVFVNGTKVLEYTATPESAAGIHKLGTHKANISYLKGLFAFAALVENVAVTDEATVKTLRNNKGIPSGDGLYLYDMSDGSGTNVTDRSGAGNDGTIVGPAVWSPVTPNQERV